MKLLGTFLIVGVLGYVSTIWILGEDFEFAAGLLFAFFYMFAFGFFYMVRNTKQMQPIKELWRVLKRGSWINRLIIIILCLIIWGGYLLLRIGWRDY